MYVYLTLKRVVVVVNPPTHTKPLLQFAIERFHPCILPSLPFLEPFLERFANGYEYNRLL